MVHHITEQERYVGSYGGGQSLYRAPQCDEKREEWWKSDKERRKTQAQTQGGARGEEELKTPIPRDGVRKRELKEGEEPHIDYKLLEGATLINMPFDYFT